MRTLTIYDIIQSRMDEMHATGHGQVFEAQLVAAVLCEITKDGDVVIKASNMDFHDFAGLIEEEKMRWRKEQRKKANSGCP